MSPSDILALRAADLRNAREFGTRADVRDALAAYAAQKARCKQDGRP